MDYKKISKRDARKRFNKGDAIFLHPSRLSWNNSWQTPYSFDNQNPYNLEFDKLVNEYSYYNCDKERGLRVIFLIQQ